MPKKILKKFQIEYLQILDKDGNADEKLMPKLTKKQILDFYEQMMLIRTFDNKALALQRQGRMGTYAQYTGQEAAQVGSVLALSSKDWMVPTYRESGGMVVRGIPMVKMFQYWGGDERGSQMPEGNNTLPISIPIASQLLHAVGIGMASNLKKEKAASVVYFGDGATSKGDTHEAMNFAGVFNTPTVFFCQNNQWAISFPREQQTKAETIAQKAIAYGFEGIQIDGNDVFAVYKATSEALKKARSGNGPTLIEAYTYRMANHTTSDDAFRYRPKEEVEHWKQRDPIDRLWKYIQKKNLAGDDFKKQVEDRISKKIEGAVHEYETIKPAPIDDIFKYTYAKMTHNLQEQLNYLKSIK